MTATSMLRTAAAAVAAAVTGCGVSMFAVMDANPSLYLYDLASRSSLLRRRRDEHFHHQRIWITGASSGLGAELAKQLASCGAHLVLSARNVEQLNQVATDCRELQPRNTDNDSNGNDHCNIVVVPVDLLQCTNLSSGSSQEIEDVIDQVLRSMGGRLDCVIFNAGQGHISPALETSLETTERMLRLNALVPMYATQRLLNKLKSSSAASGPLAPPHLVVISSLGGIMGIPLSASYVASKHALHGYFSSLQAECPWLRVDVICPGPLATDFHQNSNTLPAITTDGATRSATTTSLDSTTPPTTTTTTTQSLPSQQIYKMPVQRCAQLVVSTMIKTQNIALRQGAYHCSWVAPQPTLTGMWMHQHFPHWFHTVVLQTMGPIRVQAWKMGLNLYDSNSWKVARRALQQERQREEGPSPATSNYDNDSQIDSRQDDSRRHN